MHAAALLTLAAVAYKGLARIHKGIGPQKFNSSLEMRIDPRHYYAQQPAYWCSGHAWTCRRLCGNITLSNECDPLTLEYDCRCAANSSPPALQYYDKTMPTFICTALYEQCLKYYEDLGDLEGMDECGQNIYSHCNNTIVVPYTNGKRKCPPKNATSEFPEPSLTPVTVTATATVTEATLTTVTRTG